MQRFVVLFSVIAVAPTLWAQPAGLTLTVITTKSTVTLANPKKGGIHLTQVTPTCSMVPGGGLPAETDGVRGSVCQR